MAWHRKLIAQKYDGHDKRGPGRPRTREELEALVIRMTEENRTWGYRRIQGAMSNLGISKLAAQSLAFSAGMALTPHLSEVAKPVGRNFWHTTGN